MAANGKNGRFGRPPSPNGDMFQAFVIRELKANRRFNREQERINERLLLLITSVAEGMAKLNRRMDRQDRINGLILKEFKFLRRRAARQDDINRHILDEIRVIRRRLP